MSVSESRSLYSQTEFDIPESGRSLIAWIDCLSAAEPTFGTQSAVDAVGGPPLLLVGRAQTARGGGETASLTAVRKTGDRLPLFQSTFCTAHFQNAT